jgi:hypothetical protein
MDYQILLLKYWKRTCQLNVHERSWFFRKNSLSWNSSFLIIRARVAAAPAGHPAVAQLPAINSDRYLRKRDPTRRRAGILRSREAGYRKVAKDNKTKKTTKLSK